jgi:hypothetical protein
VNLLSGVFCYQYTAEYLGNPTISILFLQQGFALFAGFRCYFLAQIGQVNLQTNRHVRWYAFSAETGGGRRYTRISTILTESGTYFFTAAISGSFVKSR